MAWRRKMKQGAAVCLMAVVALTPLAGEFQAYGGETNPRIQKKGAGYSGDNRQALQQAGYSLVWNDEFEGSDLDFSKWDFQLGTKASDPGAPEDWGNNEAEYYTKDNYKVGNGVLTITAKKEKKENKSYTSTRIRTMKDDGTCLYAPKYGRVEARMKLPREEGLWPAFWMLPADTSVYGTWAASGEIDILEAKGRVPDRVNGTIHFGSQWPDNLYLGEEYRFDDSTDISDWHLYSVDWEPGKISWLVDNQVYFTAYASQERTASPKKEFWGRDSEEKENYAYGAPFDTPFYLILNLAVGGNYDWGANPANAEFPASMEVDYVRVWQKDQNTYQALEDNHPKGEKAYKKNGGNCIYNGSFTSGVNRLGYWHTSNASAKVRYAGSRYRADVTASGTGTAQLYQGGIFLESLKQYRMNLKLSGTSPVRVTVTGRNNGVTYTDETFQPTSRFKTYSGSFAVPRDMGTEDGVLTIETGAGSSFSAEDVNLTCVEYGGTKDAPQGSASGGNGAVAGEDYTIQLTPCNFSVLFLRSIAAGNGKACVMVNGVVLDGEMMRGMADTTASTIRIPAAAIGEGDYTIALVLDGWNAVSLTGKAAPAEKPETPALTKKELAAAQVALTKPMKSSKTSNQVKWSAVNGADGYIIYAAPCNTKGKKSSLKKIKTKASGSGGQYTQKGLKSGTWYKYRIDAYRNEDGKKVVIASSPVMHAITGGDKNLANPTGVKVSKTKVTVKKGKTLQITSSPVIPKGKKGDFHWDNKVKYVVSDPDIVKISAKGKITGKKKGKTEIYVFVQNGNSKKITVTVK